MAQKTFVDERKKLKMKEENKKMKNQDKFKEKQKVKNSLNEILKPLEKREFSTDREILVMKPVC